jgi:hypothetical protein
LPETKNDASGVAKSSTRPLKVEWFESASMSIDPRRDDLTTS